MNLSFFQTNKLVVEYEPYILFFLFSFHSQYATSTITFWTNLQSTKTDRQIYGANGDKQIDIANGDKQIDIANGDRYVDEENCYTSKNKNRYGVNGNAYIDQ